MKPVYSIIVPVFNSAAILPELYQRIVFVMESLNEDFELIFIEDCGSDNSWQVLKNIALQDKRVTAMQLLRNVGQGSATLAGLAQAKGSFIITLDDDLQHPPEELSILIGALRSNENLDVVIGVPKVKQHHFFRRLGSSFINRLNNFFIKKDPLLRMTAFRIIRYQVVNAILQMNVPYPSLGPMLLSVTRRIGNVVVEHHPRKKGKSGYTLFALLRHSLSNIVGYSVMPLHILAMIGMMGILFCGIFAIYFLTRYFIIGINVPGWMTLLLLMVTLSSFNFLAFSLIGEYVLRIMRVSTSPNQWTVRQLIQQEKQIFRTNCPPKKEEKEDAF
ncbi:glycosyltransferase family 2 protein [Legionella bozemanae]|uniref:glycosyltransferase family 2 protein n=1 Tax=Legionella bozemanae TaxID=447 RepID=UPI00399CFA31